MESKNSLMNVSNGVLLAGGGLTVLLARGLLLNPVSRWILIAAATIWGIYQLAVKPRNKTAGITAMAGAGILLVFGGLLSGLSYIAGIGLIITGGVSLVAGLFRRGH